MLLIKFLFIRFQNRFCSIAFLKEYFLCRTKMFTTQKYHFKFDSEMKGQ